MLERIRASDMADRIRCEPTTMQDYRAHASHDLALCVFTVVIYLLDKPALRAAFESARKALAAGGRMLLDIPPRALFASQSFVTGSMQRTVSVTGLGRSRYAYAEDITLNDSDGARRFSDAFTIRFWPVTTVLSVARECGFEVEADLSGRFALSGSNYYLLKRA